MSRVAKWGSLLVAYFWFNLKGNLAFRTSFALQVISMMFNDAIWVVFWLIYFAKFPVVQGWHRTDILMLWGICAVSFGMMDVVFGNTLRLGRIVSEGELDIYLSNPKAPLFHALISRQNVVGWGDILFGIGTLCFAIPFDVPTLIKTFCGILAASMLLIGFSVSAQSLIFFIGGREGIGNQLAEAFLTFSFYPSAIFRGTLIRIIIFGVMPAGFISSIPASVLDGRYPWLLWIALGVGLWQLWVARTLFYRGLRIYTSGNRITVRT
jgi:ABC-2 type transport system permease protein